MVGAALTARPRAWAQPGDTPILVCLNLQREHLDPGSGIFIPQAHETLPRIRRCIEWARSAGMPLAHVLTVRPDASGRARLSPPIDGFAPSAREPVVLKRSYSLFETAELGQADELHPFRRAFLLGFSLAHDGAAAAFSAASRGARLVFIGDATASPPLPPFSSACVNDVMQAVLSPIVPIVTADEFVARGMRAL